MFLKLFLLRLFEFERSTNLRLFLNATDPPSTTPTWPNDAVDYKIWANFARANLFVDKLFQRREQVSRIMPTFGERNSLNQTFRLLK